MADTIESQLQDIREQLDVQAEAISRLAGVVSVLEGVDAAVLSTYVLRLKRLHGPATETSSTEPPTVAPDPRELEAAAVVLE